MKREDVLRDSQRYRFVPYDPPRGIDCTWEREWRTSTDLLELDPAHTLVIVPTAEEAFEIVYQPADVETDYDDEGPAGYSHTPRWLAVSLDILGVKSPV